MLLLSPLPPHPAGSTLYVYGPVAYVPPVEVQIVKRIRAKVAIPALHLYIFFFGRIIAALFVLFVLWWASRPTAPPLVEDESMEAAAANVTEAVADMVSETMNEL